MSAKKKSAAPGKVRVTWVRSDIGRSWRQKRIIVALGLHRLHESVVHDDTPQIRGMINKVVHLVRTEPVEG
ncbi:MAG TPA: 50S ribosomal protein L30 [Bacteroidetes bacterium]|nr:50S ribosomal protein L30 [Bacteroidota bacterium]